MRYCLALGMLALAILSSNCATTERFERGLKPMMGRPIQDVLHAWGEPEQIITLPNGNIEYEYNITKRYNLILPDACVVYFEVDRHTNKIIQIRHEGSRCVRAPSFV